MASRLYIVPFKALKRHGDTRNWKENPKPCFILSRLPTVQILTPASRFWGIFRDLSDNVEEEILEILADFLEILSGILLGLRQSLA